MGMPVGVRKEAWGVECGQFCGGEGCAKRVCVPTGPIDYPMGTGDRLRWSICFFHVLFTPLCLDTEVKVKAGHQTNRAPGRNAESDGRDRW
jgi:hypothetical protein